MWSRFAAWAFLVALHDTLFEKNGSTLVFDALDRAVGVIVSNVRVMTYSSIVVSSESWPLADDERGLHIADAATLAPLICAARTIGPRTVAARRRNRRHHCGRLLEMCCITQHAFMTWRL